MNIDFDKIFNELHQSEDHKKASQEYHKQRQDFEKWYAKEV